MQNCRRHTIVYNTAWEKGWGKSEHEVQSRSREGLEAKHATYFHILLPHLLLSGSQRVGSM